MKIYYITVQFLHIKNPTFSATKLPSKVRIISEVSLKFLLNLTPNTNFKKCGYTGHRKIKCHQGDLWEIVENNLRSKSYLENVIYRIHSFLATCLFTLECFNLS